MTSRQEQETWQRKKSDSSCGPHFMILNHHFTKEKRKKIETTINAEEPQKQNARYSHRYVVKQFFFFTSLMMLTLTIQILQSKYRRPIKNLLNPPIRE